MALTKHRFKDQNWSPFGERAQKRMGEGEKKKKRKRKKKKRKKREEPRKVWKLTLIMELYGFMEF